MNLTKPLDLTTSLQETGGMEDHSMESDEDALNTLFGSQFKKMNFKNKHIHICTSTYTYTKINNTYISYTYIYYSTGQI